MMNQAPSIHVMEGRGRNIAVRDRKQLSEPEKDLLDLYHDREFFPTPPWAVRAVLARLSPVLNLSQFQLYDPCAGQGHIGFTLKKLGLQVHMSDLYDYGLDHPIADALEFSAPGEPSLSAILTNPPFSGPDYSTAKPTLAELIVRQGLRSCRYVIVLARLSFLVGPRRYDLHHANPLGNLRYMLPNYDRVSMVLGQYDQRAKTATETAWFVYEQGYTGRFETIDIPPGSRRQFEMPQDALMCVQSILDRPDIAAYLAT